MEFVAELRRRYPNEWIAVRLGPGGDRYRPERGYLLAHSPDREEVWQAVMRMASGQEAHVFFNAPEGPQDEYTLLNYHTNAPTQGEFHHDRRRQSH